jgi:hypothetical protein
VLIRRRSSKLQAEEGKRKLKVYFTGNGDPLEHVRIYGVYTLYTAPSTNQPDPSGPARYEQKQQEQFVRHQG